ncbi:hypothetical protein BVRB_5g100570 [Beta vulgaris subsp. vulgaris]|nr:hypothetical protein BVRB_5g100570 [Beta vulgaris subsp. vulgaris]
MDVFIPEDYVIKRRMERRATAAAAVAATMVAGVSVEGAKSSSRSGIWLQSGGKQANQGQSISWVDHRSDNFLHSCCF